MFTIMSIMTHWSFWVSFNYRNCGKDLCL